MGKFRDMFKKGLKFLKELEEKMLLLRLNERFGIVSNLYN
jgi:hypothetical protein